MVDMDYELEALLSRAIRDNLEQENMLLEKRIFSLVSQVEQLESDLTALRNTITMEGSTQ